MVAHPVQAAVVHDQLEGSRLIPAWLKCVTSAWTKSTGSAGSAGLGTRLVERLRREVNPGDVPSVLGEIDRRVSGAASDVECRSRRAACRIPRRVRAASATADDRPTV